MYTLNDHEQPVRVDLSDPEQVAAYKARYEDTFEGRRVAGTTVGDVLVSTVFLTVDHNWGAGADPILWETMACRTSMGDTGWSDEDGYATFQARYTSAEEAREGHREAVDSLRLRGPVEAE